MQRQANDMVPISLGKMKETTKAILSNEVISQRQSPFAIICNRMSLIYSQHYFALHLVKGGSKDACFNSPFFKKAHFSTFFVDGLQQRPSQPRKGANGQALLRKQERTRNTKEEVVGKQQGVGLRQNRANLVLHPQSEKAHMVPCWYFCKSKQK